MTPTRNFLAAFVFAFLLGLAVSAVARVDSAAAATPVMTAADSALSSAMGATPGSMLSECVLASGKYVATLTSADAGSTNTYCFATANQTARLVCSTSACYRTGSYTDGGIAANCATDDVVLTANIGVNQGVVPTFNVPPQDIAMGSDLCIVARGFDGGDPNCRALQVKYNPSGPVLH